MSFCTFLASDQPLYEVSPQKEYPLVVDIDAGTVYDGGADDNFYLHKFDDVRLYTDKKYGVWLEWNYTDGRALKLLEYIENALDYGSPVELWHIWLTGTNYYEYDESPVIRKQTIPFSALTINIIKEIDSAEVWNTPDKQNPNRPTFYCLTIEK